MGHTMTNSDATKFMLRILCAVSFFVSLIPISCVASSSTYTGYFSNSKKIADEGGRLTQNITIDMENLMISYENVGVSFDKCGYDGAKSGCLYFDDNVLSVAGICSIKERASWRESGFVFNINRIINSYDPDRIESMNRARIEVEIRSSNKLIGAFIFSNEKGIESFNLRKKNSNFVYYLVSERGVFSDYCNFLQN